MKKVNISSISNKIKFIYGDECEKNTVGIVIFSDGTNYFFDAEYKNKMSNEEVEALLLRGALVYKDGKYYRPTSFDNENVSLNGGAVVDPGDIEVDLSNYATKEYVDGEFATKVDNADIEIYEKIYRSLFDDAIIIENKFCNTSGKINKSDGWAYAEIPIKPNTTYSIYFEEGYYDPNRGAIIYKDNSGNILSDYVDWPSVSKKTIGKTSYRYLTSPENAYILCITITRPNSFDSRDDAVIVEGDTMSESDINNSNSISETYVKSINGIQVYHPFDSTYGVASIAKPLNGKTWVVVGDSLTAVNDKATKRYHDYIADDLGLTVINLGIGGKGYKRGDDQGHAFYNTVSSIPTNADIITIFGSGNDNSSGAEIGNPTDDTADTICGCMNLTLTNLFANIPGARVGIITPCPWGQFPTNVNNNWMMQYSDALIAVARLWGVPVLDLYRESNMRPWEETFRNLYYKNDNGGSVHPDEDGHRLLANKIKMFVQSL